MELPVSVFSDLSASVQEEILKRNVIFQGENISLKNLLTPSRYIDYDNIIDASLLSKLNNNEEISIGVALNLLNTDVTQCYIPRSFNCYDEVLSEEQVCIMGENEWANDLNIPSIPGSGKSTVLDHLAFTIKKNYPHLWVIKIDFNDYTECLAKFKESKVKLVTIVDVLNSRAESWFKNDLERKIFAIPYKVVLIVDGLEDIFYEYADIVDDIMADYYLKRNILKVCMTSSEYMDNSQIFSWPNNTLVPLTKDEQILLFKKCVEQKLGSKTEEMFEVCAEIVNRECFHEEDTLVGLPLQITMLADVICSLKSGTDFYEFLLLNLREIQPKKISLPRLYLLYVHKNCSNDEIVLNVDFLMANMEKIVEKSHYNLYKIALEQILTKKQCKLFINYKKNIPELPEELFLTNIVQKLVSCVRFSHRTLAEYFLVHCLVKELRQTENEQFLTFFIEVILTKRDFRLVRLFFEDIINFKHDSIPRKTSRCIGHISSENPTNVLFNLAQEGHLETFKFLLECFKLVGVGLDLDILRSEGETLLQTVINAGKFDLMEFLCEQGVFINGRDDNGRTPLHYAVKKGSLSAVKYLVLHGAEVNCRDNTGRTPFHDAALLNSREIMEFLISRQAEDNSKDKNDRTLLLELVHLGNIDLVKFLVLKSVNIKNKAYLETVIYEAAKKRRMDVLNYLLEKFPEVSFRSEKLRTILHKPFNYIGDPVSNEKTIETLKLLIERGADVNAINGEGVTVFSSYASVANTVEILEFLVNNGADPKRKDNSFSSLDWALRCGDLKTVKYLMEINVPYSKKFFRCIVQRRLLDLVKYLLEKGADFNFEPDNPLVQAVRNNDMDMIKVLVKAGGDVNSQGNGCLIETTLLEDAVECCDFDIVDYLVERGAKGEYVLEYAAARGDLRLVKYFQERGECSDEIRDVGGNLELLQYLLDKNMPVNLPAILNNAAIKGRVDIAKYLIGRGVDVSYSHNCHRRSALHEAAKHDFLNVVELLLKHGADVHCKDDKGETPLNKAFRHEKLKVAEVLVRNGADIKNVLGEDPEDILCYIYSFGKIKFLVDHLEKVDIYGKLEKYVFVAALKGGCFDVAEYLVEKSEGDKTVVDVVKRLMESEDNQVLDLFNRWDTVRYLLERGMRVGEEEIEKYDLLIGAASGNDFKYVKYLVEKGADVNHKDEEGYTALHKTSDFGIAKYLVGRGADVNAKTNEGWSVLHEAVKGGNLLEKGAVLTEEESRTALQNFVHFEGLHLEQHVVLNEIKRD